MLAVFETIAVVLWQTKCEGARKKTGWIRYLLRGASFLCDVPLLKLPADVLCSNAECDGCLTFQSDGMVSGGL